MLTLHREITTMANLREVIAGALNTSDMKMQEYECSADRVGALAFTDRLGSLLWHTKYAGQQDSVKSAILLLQRFAYKLAKKNRWSNESELINKLCVLAFTEWYDNRCIKCGGRSFLRLAEKPVMCSVCQGTGLLVVGDKHRAQLIGIPVDTFSKWQRRYSEIQDILTRADKNTNTAVIVQLERDQ